MQKKTFLFKRALAIFLTVTLMLSTLITFNVGSLISSAQQSAITVTDNQKENVYFYVPEQIYLAPDLDAHLTQDRYSFQWFVDSEIDRATHTATPRTGENSNGNFYFYYKNATSVTVSFKYLNQDLSIMDAYTSTSQSNASVNYANQNSTIKLAASTVALSASNTRTDVARTRYTVATNTIDTTVTREGLSPYLLADTTGYYIEWTVSYVDGADGYTKAIRAYTYVYKPFIQPSGTALRTENNRGTNSFGQNISWLSGIHGFTSTGSYYPKSEQGTRGLVVFSSSNPQGVQLGKTGTKYYAQWANSIVANGRFGYQTDNNGSVDWLSSSETELFKIPSFNYLNNSTDGSNSGDNAFYTFLTAPTANIMVDSSRYSNFSQIPNLSVGMMVTDDEATEGSGAWYIADMAGRSDSLFSDADYQKNSTSTSESYWNNYNSIFAGEGTYASPVGSAEVNEVKYNGPWIKSLSGSSTSGYYNIRTAYFNHDGSGDHYGGDTIWNVSVLPVYVTVNNKQSLRDAYENATNYSAYLGLREDGTSPYYNSTSSYWTKYVDYYKAAGQLLANLDTMTSITVNGTTYTCDQLATALNSSITNVQTARFSSKANAKFFALEQDSNGDYILKTIKDVKTGEVVADEVKSYNFGNTVSFNAPEYPGYSYVGCLDGINYTDGTSIGSDYNTLITNKSPNITSRYIDYNNIAYTLIYIPKQISSIVDTEDGVYNYLKTITSDLPEGAGYPSATAREGVITDFNYIVEGNDVIAWSTKANKSEQYMFLPFCVDLVANTSYRVTYDVTGADESEVQLTFVNNSFTGGNGVSTSIYAVNVSGDVFTTNGVDKGNAYVKLELSGDARNGKTVRISNICVTTADENELYLDTTKGYPAVYSPATSAPKTDIGYTTTGVSKVVLTTRYSTLMYDQFQLLPYYVQLKPNCSYSVSYDILGIDPARVKISLYNESFTGGNGSNMNYYEFGSNGGTITTGSSDDAVAQLRVDVLDAAAGTKITFENLKIENLDSKTTISGTFNQTTTLSIPVKEGYKLNGWTLKSNSGGTANGSVASTGNDRIYEYTFGSGIDIIEAEWVPATLKVVFRAEDGTVVSEQDVTYGNAATAPATAPEKFGHTFAGWDADFTNVTKNLIIEPLYTEKDINVTVTAEDTEIFAGSTTKVTATFEPNEPEISAVEWTTSNNAIATVNSEGVVTGVAQGTATITGTITYDGRTYSASTTVKVNPVEVTAIAVNTMPDKTTLYTGDEFDPTGLTLTVTYNNGTTAVVSEGMTFNAVNTTYAGTKTVRVTYGGKTTTFRVTVVELAVESIEITKLPDTTEYFFGDEELDTTGIVVEAVYNNGEREVIDEDELYFEGFDTSAPGEVEIVVYYEDFEASFNITVKALDVTKLAIKTMPKKTSYFVGEKADYAGLTLTATYSNGVTTTVTEGYTVTGFDSTTVGTKTLTVEYEGKTVTFDVTVKAIELVSIEIVTPAEKTEYFVGDAADYTGLTVKATYNNGTTEMIEDYTVTGFDSMTAGQKTITVEYNGKTATYNVTVKAIELVSIEIVTPAEKTEYFVGDAADYTGLTVKATYNNGTTAMIEDYTVTGFDSMTAGQKTITVEYNGKTAAYNVTVKAIELVSLVIATNPAKTTYYTNEVFDATGLTLTATYNNGTTAEITEGFAVGAVDMTTEGTKNVTVTYEGKTVSFNITVNALYITNVEINTMPDKTEYMIGEAEDNTGLTLKVTYNDGSAKVVNDGFTVFGFDSSVKGTVTMMVEYAGYYLTYDVTIIGKADFSKVDALLAEFKAEDPLKYTNYDEINLVYVYDFENTTLPLAKKAYTSEKDQAEVDALYNELKGYYDMLEPIPDEPVIVERFEIVGGAKVVKQSGVNYIVGLQPSLTKAKFQSTYADYENVTLVFNMTTARYMGTGSTLTVKSTITGEVIAEYVIVIYGDVDGSATINGRDAAAVSNSITGVADSLTGAAKLAANVEGARATINAKDASVIRAVAGGSMTIDQSTGKGVEI